jgi:hypothetical protein
MYRRFHDRFGTAGVVIAAIALITALGGTAFAAGGLTSQQEKQVKKIAKKYAGKSGAPGATGPAGPAGNNGKDGTNGTDGKSVTVTEIEAGEPECGELGGALLQEEGSPEGVEVCNGAEGPLVDTLPSGKSLIGAWGFTGAEAVVTISYQFSLSSALPEGDIVFVKPSEDESTNCPGTEANPLAAKGKLCLYSEVEETAYLSGFGGFPHSTVAGVSAYMTAEGFGRGTWALTAP